MDANELIENEVMNNGGDDGFKEWKAAEDWSLHAHTVIPWASLTCLWEFW